MSGSPKRNLDVSSRDVLGFDAAFCEHHVKFNANRRRAQLGLQPLFAEPENPLAWMSEAMDPRKQKDFFETRGTEHEDGGALASD